MNIVRWVTVNMMTQYWAIFKYSSYNTMLIQNIYQYKIYCEVQNSHRAHSGSSTVCVNDVEPVIYLLHNCLKNQK